MIKTVNIHEAKTRLSELIALLETQGGEVIICRYGSPIAHLVPLQKIKKGHLLRKHPVLSKVKIRGDITAPLSKEDWPQPLR